METIEVTEIHSKIKAFDGGYAIFWLFDKIELKKCPVEYQIDTENLVECRVFDTKKEILIRRKGNGFVYRERTDKEPHTTKTAVIRGEIAKQLKGENFEGRIHLVKREYIGYNDQGAATYVDSRFVGFDIKTDKKDEKGQAQ
jgi:hypothetical protein